MGHMGHRPSVQWVTLVVGQSERPIVSSALAPDILYALRRKVSCSRYSEDIQPLYRPVLSQKVIRPSFQETLNINLL
jgi:hypothetical protein